MHLDILADPVGDRNNHRARELHQSVPHVLIHNRLLRVVLPADREVNLGHPKHPHILGEHVIAVDANSREVADVVELEHDLDRGLVDGVVLPPDPLVPLLPKALGVKPEVGMSELTVHKLAQTRGQVFVLYIAIIGEIVEVHFGTSAVSLWHVIRYNRIWKI